MKEKSTAYAILFVAISILIFSNVLLYVQNISFENENRELILQNDLIMSANIHLKDTLKKVVDVSLSLK